MNQTLSKLVVDPSNLEYIPTKVVKESGKSLTGLVQYHCALDKNKTMMAWKWNLNCHEGTEVQFQ